MAAAAAAASAMTDVKSAPAPAMIKPAPSDPIFDQALADWMAASEREKENVLRWMRRASVTQSIESICQEMVEDALEKGLPIGRLAPLTNYGALPASWKPLVDADAVMRAVLTDGLIGILTQDAMTVSATDNIMTTYRSMTEVYKTEIKVGMLDNPATADTAKIFELMRTSKQYILFAPLIADMAARTWNNSAVPDEHIRLWLLLNETTKSLTGLTDVEDVKVVFDDPAPKPRCNNPHCENPNCPQRKM